MTRCNFLLVYFFLFSLNVNAQTATDYYPFDVGNYWVYKKTEMGENTGVPEIVKTEIECIEEVNNRMAYRIKNTVIDENKNPVSSHYGWHQIESDSILYIALGTSPDLTLIEWDPPLIWLSSDAGNMGAAWTNKMEGQHTDYPDSTIITWWHYKVVSNSETVKVTAGSFEKCIKIHDTIESSIEESFPVTYHYYAPNVGEVLRITENPNNTVSRTELIEYSVDMK